MLEYSLKPKEPAFRRLTTGVQSPEIAIRRKNLAVSGSPSLKYMESVKRSDRLNCVQALYDECDYAAAARPGEEVCSLPDVDPHIFENDSLGKMFLNRYSTREYSDKKINASMLSALLRYSAGLSTPRKEFPTRTYPSGGAFYSIDLWAYVNSVDGLETGLYFYSPFEHSLYRSRNTEKAVGDYIALCFKEQCDVIFIMSHNLEKQFTRYEDLSYKLSLLEAGHLAQNILLVGTAMGINGSPLLAYEDARLNAAMALEEPFKSIAYVIEMGL